ncbi:Proteasomal ubiquitin receptor ADRM1-like protein [Aphelenchoides besseyi]|nr:Proteasomal ubiquitin receptor ADRM1-like protein [Aphelenchoides besseyi]
MSILFANTSRSQGASSGNLLEFKAGRTILEPGSTPEKRKAVAEKARGLVFIKQSNDQLMHFCWKNRDKNTTDMVDLIIFPGDTEFVRIKECQDGRVYMLKFKSTDDHKLFWLQEPRQDKDDEYCKKVNDLLNNPPSTRTRAGGERSGGGNAGTMAALNSAIGSEDIGALGNMDQNQLMQLFSLMNGGNSDLLPQLSLNTARSNSPAPDTPKTRKETSGTGNAANKFDANMLNQIISSLPSSASSPSSKRAVDLSKVLTRANVENVVNANSQTLTPHLPSTSDGQELSHTIGSPQFQQAADFFSYALQSGQLGPALRQFNLPERVIKAADSGDFIKFSKELTSSLQGKNVDKQINAEAANEESTEGAAKNQKDDDSMDLD